MPPLGAVVGSIVEGRNVSIPLVEDRRPGTRIAAFEVVATLGKGVVATVYECRDPSGLRASGGIHFGLVAWPPKAVRVRIERDRGIANVFEDEGGNEVGRLDCAAAAARCYR